MSRSLSWPRSFLLPGALMAIGFFSAPVLAAPPEAKVVIAVWPDKPPGETAEIPPEKAETTPDKPPSITRISNVSKPTLHLFKPDPAKDTGTAVVICPGGGHRILAWDLEGTEVAQWFNERGVTAIVLKYRVPARGKEKQYLAAVRDAQRAVSLVRSKASEWKIDPKKIGILGFSAGGEVAALTALFDRCLYDPIDNVDNESHKPNFAALIYPAYLVDKDSTKLQEHVKATRDTPPMFLAHAHDDGVTPLSSALLYIELKRNKIPAELHIVDRGGHGYGLRPAKNNAVLWPARLEQWMEINGWLKK